MHATIFVKSDPVICDQPPASRQLTADKLVTTPAQHSTAQPSRAQPAASQQLNFPQIVWPQAGQGGAQCCGMLGSGDSGSATIMKLSERSQDRMCQCNFQ